MLGGFQNVAIWLLACSGGNQGVATVCCSDWSTGGYFVVARQLWFVTRLLCSCLAVQIDHKFHTFVKLFCLVTMELLCLKKYICLAVLFGHQGVAMMFLGCSSWWSGSCYEVARLFFMVTRELPEFNWAFRLITNTMHLLSCLCLVPMEMLYGC